MTKFTMTKVEARIGVHEDYDAFTLEIEFQRGIALTYTIWRNGDAPGCAFWEGNGEFSDDMMLPAHILGWIKRVREWAEIAAGLRENPCANWVDGLIGERLLADQARPSATILPMPSPDEGKRP